MYSDSDEVEALLEKRYREILARRREEERRKRELEEEVRRQEILRTILTPEARERLSNIRLVRPEIARAVEDRLIALALQGRISQPITDEELKSILAEIYERTRKDFRISIREK
ncbi:DNA-binding protein [Ignisphaera cupida]|uniref:DNA-binding protein n=1 Tax=Ignisphaera cupida TaxID=3050454 RepID=UPI003307B026